MTECRCRSVELAWWHIRLLYVLIGLLVVVYGCSVTWLLTTRVLDPDCEIHGQGHGPSDDQAGALDRLIPGNSLRVRRSQPRRRSPPAFYRDSINVDSGNTVDSDEWIWMSTYSKIPVSIQWLKCKIRGGGTLHCGWGVKAGMCYTRAISERFGDKELIIKRYINSPSFLLFTFRFGPLTMVVCRFLAL